MNNQVCAACGHVNRIGAFACEACDARLYAAGGGEPSGPARARFGAPGELSWADPEPHGSGAWEPGESIPAPPFKGVGDVVSPMLAVYRKHFTLVGLLVLLTTLPQGLLQYYVVHYTEVQGAPGLHTGPSPAGVLLLWLLTAVGGALLSASLVYAVADLQRTGRSSAGACLARGAKALPNVFLLSLLYSLVTGLGFILFVVPGIIFILMFAVRVPAAVLEGRGPIEALRRSHELTGGYKGLIFITYFLWWVLTLVLNWLLVGSFARGGSLDLPTVLLQTAASGMLNSSLNVLTVYVYLGLLRERGHGVEAGAFAHGPEAAAG